MHLIIQGANAAADTLQSAAGIVADLVFPDNTAFDFGTEREKRFQLLKERVQTVGQIFLGVMTPVGFTLPAA